MLGGDTGAPATGRAAPNPFGKVSQLHGEEDALLLCSFDNKYLNKCINT